MSVVCENFIMLRYNRAIALCALLLFGCGEGERHELLSAGTRGEYLGIATNNLDRDLVLFFGTYKGKNGEENVREYVKCAAFSYALERGHAFSQHIVTNISRTHPLWHGEGVFLISDTLPNGRHKFDNEVELERCRMLGVPI